VCACESIGSSSMLRMIFMMYSPQLQRFERGVDSYQNSRNRPAQESRSHIYKRLQRRQRHTVTRCEGQKSLLDIVVVVYHVQELFIMNR
jgi:hypothetical protein